jgi:kynurenine formamidase
MLPPYDPDGKNLDHLPNETFLASAWCRREGAPEKDRTCRHKVTSSQISEADFLLFRTGWSEKWGTEDYLKGYPVLSPLSAEWLAEKKLKGVGFDAISADPVDSASNEVHRILLSSGLVLLENLRDLDKVGYRPFCMAALPISLTDQDGGPARVMAVLESRLASEKRAGAFAQAPLFMSVVILPYCPPSHLKSSLWRGHLQSFIFLCWRS